MNNCIKALRICHIDVNKILLDFDGKKRKIIPLFYGQTDLIFQTPFMIIDSSANETSNVHCITTLLKGDSKSKMQAFYKFIDELENVVMDQLEDHNNTLPDPINMTFRSFIRGSEEMDIGEHIKWPIIVDGDNIFVDEEGSSLNHASISSGDKAKLIVKISGLWIMNDACGLMININKVMIKKFEEQTSTNQYSFEESSSDDADNNSIISVLETDQQKTSQRKVLNSKSAQASAQASATGNASMFKSINPKKTASISPHNKNAQKDSTTVDGENIFYKETSFDRRSVANKMTAHNQAHSQAHINAQAQLQFSDKKSKSQLQPNLVDRAQSNSIKQNMLNGSNMNKRVAQEKSRSRRVAERVTEKLAKYSEDSQEQLEEEELALALDISGSGSSLSELDDY